VTVTVGYGVTHGRTVRILDTINNVITRAEVLALILFTIQARIIPCYHIGFYHMGPI
jgi:hypothetical protein